jgi:hypothetical protein
MDNGIFFFFLLLFKEEAFNKLPRPNSKKKKKTNKQRARLVQPVFICASKPVNQSLIIIEKNPGKP